MSNKTNQDTQKKARNEVRLSLAITVDKIDIGFDERVDSLTFTVCRGLIFSAFFLITEQGIADFEISSEPSHQPQNLKERHYTT